MDEKEIDELLMSLDANVPDEWEGGLTCSPQNRDVVKAWLAKHRLAKCAADRAICICPKDILGQRLYYVQGCPVCTPQTTNASR